MKLKKIVKRNKKTFIISGIVLGIALLLVLFFTGAFGKPLATVPLDTQIGQCSGGWTTFSISNVVINSDKSRIRVYGVAKGSECMNIQLSASQLDSYVNSQGMDATRDVIGSIKLLEYTKTFPIDRTGRNYYNLMNNQVASGTSLWSTSLQSCIDKGYSNAVYVYRPYPLADLRCVLPGVNGIEGNFNSARSYGNFKVQFTLDGQSAYVTREQQSISLGNNYIEWTGNLENLDQIYPPQYDARLIGSKWDLVEKGIYTQLDTRLSNFFQCMQNSQITVASVFGFISDGAYDNCKSQFDSSILPLFQNKLSKYITDNSALIYDADTDSNALYVSLKATPFPTFILDLDAQSVGIITLEGKPQITSCVQTQNDLRSGQNKIVTFSVKNNANVNNVEFYGSINCNQGITSFIPNFYMNANQEKQITTELIPANPNQADLPFSCTLKISDLKSGSSDSCSFSGKIAYESGIICQPNSLTCDSQLKNILKCTSDGKNTVVYQECEYGCELVSGTAKCRGEQIPSTKCEDCDAYAKSKILGGIFPSQKCEPKLLQGTLTCVFSFIKLLLLPLMFIFTLLFGFQLFDDILKKSVRKEKTRKIISLILSLIVSFLIALLVFYIFWLGVVVFFVWIIFKIIVGSTLGKIKMGIKRLR